MTKLSTICLSLLIASGIVGCDNNSIILPDEGDNLPLRGYFKGLVNGETVNIEQKEGIEDYDIGPMAIFPSFEHTDSFSYYRWFANFTIAHGNRNISLNVAIQNMNVGSYDINTPPQKWHASEISAADYTQEEHKIYSVVKPGNTFHVQINSINKNKYPEHFPIIAGFLEGTLYNEEDPNDSMIFKDINFKVQNVLPE